MRYLTITADYRSSGIKEDGCGYLKKGELEVTESLWDQLQDWVNRYQPIIPLDQKERQKKDSLIDQLDKQGMELLSLFQRELGPEYKIRYYSEGCLKYLI